MKLAYRISCVAAAILAAACGGKVAVDTHGAGGTPTSGTGGGGGGDCASLGAALSAAVEAARACNPVLDVIQCSGSAIINDGCGCPIVANEQQSTHVSDAQGLYSAWISTGCGPIECFACPPSPMSTPWYCDGNTGKCEAALPK
jgi:hypothetical protein